MLDRGSISIEGTGKVPVISMSTQALMEVVEGREEIGEDEEDGWLSCTDRLIIGGGEPTRQLDSPGVSPESRGGAYGPEKLLLGPGAEEKEEWRCGT